MLDSSTLQSRISREERFAIHLLKFQHLIQYLTTGNIRQDWTWTREKSETTSKYIVIVTDLLYFFLDTPVADFADFAECSCSFDTLMTLQSDLDVYYARGAQFEQTF